MMRGAVLTAILVLAGCGEGASDASAQQAAAGSAPAGAPVQSAPPHGRGQTPAFPGQTRAPGLKSNVAYTVETVATGLGRPWALEVLPDGRMLVTEKEGALRVVRADGTALPPVVGTPEVVSRQQGGMLDVAVKPAAGGAMTLCLSYSEPRSDGNGTSVNCGTATFSGDTLQLRDMRTVFRQQPSWNNGMHFGSRIMFGPDDTIFVSLGERNTGRDDGKPSQFMAQGPENNFGKTVRVRIDGAAPADNPFASKGGAAAFNWSIGHRNIQAATLHPKTGALWTVEHGPLGGDELNLVRPGRNYGWPVISYGVDYTGKPVTGGETRREGMEQPVYYWDPVIAPSGMLFYTGDAFPAWQGNLFIGGLQAQGLVRLVLDGERVVGEEWLKLGARIRDVGQGPDGSLYALTDESNGRILRLRPER